jgi:hypothetical protein
MAAHAALVISTFCYNCDRACRLAADNGAIGTLCKIVNSSTESSSLVQNAVFCLGNMLHCSDDEYDDDSYELRGQWMQAIFAYGIIGKLGAMASTLRG